MKGTGVSSTALSLKTPTILHRSTEYEKKRPMTSEVQQAADGDPVMPTSSYNDNMLLKQSHQIPTGKIVLALEHKKRQPEREKSKENSNEYLDPTLREDPSTNMFADEKIYAIDSKPSYTDLAATVDIKKGFN